MNIEATGCSAARVMARLARIVEVGLAKVDLTPAQYRTLMLLADGSAQASKMAEHLAVSRPSVTAVVDGLVHRGLVARRQDDKDRRRVGHTITPAGRDLLAEADASLEAAFEEILAHVENPETRRSALGGLEAWHQALREYRLARQSSGAVR